MKEPIKRVKRQLVEQEKILSSHTSDKALIFKIYNEFKQLLNKKTNNNPLKTWKKNDIKLAN